MTDHDVLVYRYGIRGDLPAGAIEEIHAAHRLRNSLVEIEHGHAERIAEIWAAHPEVARAEAVLAEIDTRLSETFQRAAEERKRRGKPGQTPEMREELKTAKVERREAKAVVKAAKESAYPTMKPRMVEARLARKAAIKGLYKSFVEDGGYWATYNEVTQHHEIAMRAIASKRKAGQPADIRFHRWDGSGTCAVQIQRQALDPLRSAAMLADPEGKWRNVLQVNPYLDPEEWATWTRPEKRQRGRGTLKFRVGSGAAAQMIEVPVILHRPLPAGSDVTLARITRRMIAGKARCTVSLVCRIPAVSAPTEGEAIAVHLGWRSRDDGTVRVAIIDGPVDPPDSISEYVHHIGARRWEVRANWGSTTTHLAELAGQRDRNHNIAKAKLVQWLSAQSDLPLYEEEPLTVGRVKQWRSPNRLARLTLAWRENPPDDAEGLPEELEAWRRQDKHLWTWHANLADKIAARRTDLWRCIAAWVTTNAATVIVDDWSVAQLTMIDPTDNSYHAQGARRLRALASPAGLRSSIEETARRKHIETLRVTMPKAMHHACETELEGDRATSIMLWCPTCEVLVDQDVQTVERMLDEVRAA